MKGGVTTRARRHLLLAVIAVALLAALVASPARPGLRSPPALPGPKSQSALPGPFFTFLFSRTEITGAVNCEQNDDGIARLDTEVAPYLAGIGFAATGTLVTDTVKASATTCTHSGSSLMGSWQAAASLAQTYGWSFVSHTATYPADIESLSPQGQYDETCGSAKTIDAHGLPGGHGLIAYPGAHHVPVDVQSTYGAQCFAWGRRYGSRGTTDIAAGTQPPYWQITTAPSGGPCNDPNAACYTMTAAGSTRYVLPTTTLANLAALGPGRWMTVQAFILVKNTNPPGSPIQWNCNAADVRRHWTTDSERYCWRDWKAVADAVAARADVSVTDPLTVGVAFGRPAEYP